mmetsp:Transcript_62290/g.109745  ORF Transcript_62290/g.109745 Transcript_62290/m.109745 type:complete len:266 (-) Transcript_62290:643-1440(-)
MRLDVTRELAVRDRVNLFGGVFAGLAHSKSFLPCGCIIDHGVRRSMISGWRRQRRVRGGSNGSGESFHVTVFSHVLLGADPAHLVRRHQAVETRIGRNVDYVADVPSNGLSVTCEHGDLEAELFLQNGHKLHTLRAHLVHHRHHQHHVVVHGHQQTHRAARLLDEALDAGQLRLGRVRRASVLLQNALVADLAVLPNPVDLCPATDSDSINHLHFANRRQDLVAISNTPQKVGHDGAGKRMRALLFDRRRARHGRICQLGCLCEH